jgi:hypothetical protein
MTDRRGPRRTQLTLVRDGNYKFSFAIEKLSELWQGRSDVEIQQRGSGHASYARALIVPELALARTPLTARRFRSVWALERLPRFVKECDVIP